MAKRAANRTVRARKAPGSQQRPAASIWSRPRAPTRSARYRIALIDDHTVVRDGLTALLGLERDLEVVGCAGDVAQGLELIRSAHPDIVLCDLNLPGISGGQAVSSLCKHCPGVALLVVTAHDALEYVRAAFIGGAIGYVCKDAPRSELLRAIRRAASGRRTVAGNVWESVILDWVEYLPPAAPLTNGTLSEEDCRVVRQIALGLPTWRIAEDLGRGLKAVEKQRTALMRRLGLHSASAVTRFAVDNRLVSSLELDKLLQAGES